jgi:hypothetical protein
VVDDAVAPVIIAPACTEQVFLVPLAVSAGRHAALLAPRLTSTGL